MRKTDELGDQHATPTELAWLAGFIDGEGSILLHKDVRKGRVDYRPRVSWANTDPAVIDHADTILRKLGIRALLYEQDRAEWKKIVLHAQLCRFAQIEVLLTALMPYLVGKRAKASLLLKWTRDRIARGKELVSDEKAYLEMRAMNTRGAVRDIEQDRASNPRMM